MDKIKKSYSGSIGLYEKILGLRLKTIETNKPEEGWGVIVADLAKSDWEEAVKNGLVGNWNNAGEKMR